MFSANYTEDQYSAIVDEGTMDVLREVFNRADEHGDLIVRRATILNDFKVVRIDQARSNGEESA